MLKDLSDILADSNFLIDVSKSDHRPPLSLRNQLAALVSVNRTLSEAHVPVDRQEQSNIILAVGATIYLCREAGIVEHANAVGLTAAAMAAYINPDFRDACHLRSAEMADDGLDLGVADTLLSAILLSANSNNEEDLGEGLAM